MRKSPILKKRLSEMGMSQGKLVIGIVGTHKGAGVTHFGILLAQYISECLGRRTAYVEYFPQNEIQYLEYYCNNRCIESDENIFKIHKVIYYKSVQEKKIGEIIGDNYDCILLDFGSEFLKGKNEFLRCDKKIVLSSMALWKRQELEKFIEKTSSIKNSDQWTYIIPFAKGNDVKQYSKEFQRLFLEMSYEPDLYKLSEATIHLFQRLI